MKALDRLYTICVFKVGSSLSIYKGTVLPFSIVAVVGMMIFPLPQIALDSLLICNIAFALALIISSVYLSDPSKFTSLPTILLLATLFRLGLNISTTRQILSQAQAPQIITAFGNFVVQGNVFVGIVIFLIITLVQFLVIAKGSERIAEVAARFALDAMPGKQISIDADIRAGIIGFDEAREKRWELHRESKLFGSLDGAMKFVKGDAVAGLLITVINIAAGLALGVVQHNLSISDSFERYALFTIGDGLVSQIPALLVAVAAGIVVTRVEEKEDSVISVELFDQLSREPKALFVSSFVLLLMAFIPGLPATPLIITSVVFYLSATNVSAKQSIESKFQERLQFTPRIYSPLVLRLSSTAAYELRGNLQLSDELQELRRKTFDTWGVIVPDIHFDIDSSLLSTKAMLFVNGSYYSETSDKSTNKTTSINADKHRIYFESERNLSSMILDMISDLLANDLDLLIDDTHTRMLFEVYQATSEDLINCSTRDEQDVTTLTKVLRKLIEEKIPIKEFRNILQAILELKNERRIGTLIPGCSHQTSEQQLSFTETLSRVRARLLRSISNNLPISEGKLEVICLSPSLESTLSKFIINANLLNPNLIEELGESLSQAISAFPRAVVLTSPAIRTLIFELYKKQISNLKVIAVNEVLPHLSISMVEQINIECTEDSIPKIENNQMGQA